MEPGFFFFSVVPIARSRGQCAQTGIPKLPSKHQEELLYCAGDGPLELVAEGDCGVSLLGDLLKQLYVALLEQGT